MAEQQLYYAAEDKLGHILGGFNDSLLHQKLRKALTQLPPDVVLQLVNDFEGTMRNPKGEIRNPAAYFSTVLQRTITAVEEDRANIRIQLSPVLERRIAQLVDKGFCRSHEIENRCREVMADMGDELALRALAELEQNDRATIKNVGAFFMGILQNIKVAASNISFPPAPPVIPRDLLFGYGDTEYIPEMPRQYGRPRVSEVYI